MFNLGFAWPCVETVGDAPMRSCLHLSDAFTVCCHSPRHLHQIEYLGSTVNHNPLPNKCFPNFSPNWKISFSSFHISGQDLWATFSHNFVEPLLTPLCIFSYLLWPSQPGRKNIKFFPMRDIT